MNDQLAAESLPADPVAIVGVGLIGGSIAAALKKRAFRGRIIGVGRSAARLEQARRAGLIDEAATDLAHAAAQARMLIFCTPVDRIAEGVQSAADHCAAETIITDAGSVKGPICRTLDGALPDGVTFIGSHPLAGSEKNGFEHAAADLYVDRVCVITPDVTAPRRHVEQLTRFWEALGLTVVEMSAADHDVALAQTSHVPHVVASALAAALSQENRHLAATGFADTTRIAAGDPGLWTEILLANAEAVSDRLSEFSHRLSEFRSAIANRDEALLQNLLQEAKRNRETLDDR